MWQNQRVLDILNKPLTTTVDRRATRDPIQEGARYDQLVATVAGRSANVVRVAARAADATTPQLKSALLDAADEQRARSRKLAPEVQRAQAGHPRRLRAVHADAEGRPPTRAC